MGQVWRKGHRAQLQQMTSAGKKNKVGRLNAPFSAYSLLHHRTLLCTLEYIGFNMFD